jgi:hypothetical protein
MTTDHEPSLADLIASIPRDEIMQMIARRGRVNAQVFLEALYLDLDNAIERLEDAGEHYVADTGDKLTRFLAAQLASAGYDASCEFASLFSGLLKVENRAARVTWIAGAETSEIYDEPGRIVRRILILLNRDVSGRHPHAGFLLYIRHQGSARIIEQLKRALLEDEEVGCSNVRASEREPVFTSEHLHASGFPITIRHHPVLLGRGDDVDSKPRAATSQPRWKPRPPTDRHGILFLAANPNRTTLLALDLEAHAIQGELERSGHRDHFEFVTGWAVEPLDLLRVIRKHRPSVVHFSSLGGQAPVGEEPRGLSFPGPDGQARIVPTHALARTFGAVGDSVKLVVLNGCYSEPQAEVLLAYVDCIVGVRGSLGDDAARSFAIGFYGGLGEGEPVAVAYEQGRAAINLTGLPDHDCAQLQVRPGLDARKLVLIGRPR